MRAVVITRRGGPEVLQVQEVETPLAGPGQVRVRVRAAGVNRAEVLQRIGLYGDAPKSGPEIPGLEFAGEVDQAGAGSTWKPGDRVFGIVSGGGQAEYVVAADRAVVPVPDSLDDVSAGAVPEAYVTAHDALFSRAQLRMGEQVFVNAAGSSVGIAAVHLARHAGARVLAGSRTPAKRERLASLGAVPIDTRGPWLDALRAANGGRGVDVITDFVGATDLEQNLAALEMRGRMIVIGLLGGVSGEINLGMLLGKRLRIEGTTLKARPPEEKIAAIQAFAREVVPLLADGRIKPIVDRVYPAQAIQAAHTQMENNENFGKIVITF